MSRGNRTSLSELVRNRARSRTYLGDQDVPNILEYFDSDWGINQEGRLRLFPVQRFALKLFYGIPLDDANPVIEIRDKFSTEVLETLTETEYLQKLWEEDRCNLRKQDFRERHTLVLVWGRRSGKSALSSVISSYEPFRLLHHKDPFRYYGLMATAPIEVVCVAADKDQAGIVFSGAQNHFLTVPFFSQYKANHTLSLATFQTARDIETGGRWNKGTNSTAPTSIKVTFKACQSVGTRGHNNLVVVLDEFAHFKDSSDRSNSGAVWDAITPSTASFSPADPDDSMRSLGPTDARVIVISSPWVKKGKFYELFDSAFKADEGDDILVIQAPTWEVNPTVDSSYLKGKYHDNPDTFMVEFGARFSDSVRGWIEREEDLLACVDPGLRVRKMGSPRVSYCYGIDLGVVRGQDGSSITISHPDRDRNDVVIDYHEAVYAGERLPPGVSSLFSDGHDWAVSADKLDFEDLGKWLYLLTRKFRVKEGLFDQWMGIAFEQVIKKQFKLTRIDMQKFSEAMHSEQYQTFKVLMYDRRVRFPFDLPRLSDQGKDDRIVLLAELMDLEAEFKSRNIVKVRAPKIRGYHDDRSDSLVRSVWLSAKHLRDTKRATGAVPTVGPMGGLRPPVDVVRRQARDVRMTMVRPKRGKSLSLLRRRTRTRGW